MIYNYADTNKDGKITAQEIDSLDFRIIAGKDAVRSDGKILSKKDGQPVFLDTLLQWNKDYLRKVEIYADEK